MEINVPNRFFHKSAKTIQWRKDSQQMVLEQLNIHGQNKRTNKQKTAMTKTPQTKSHALYQN